ncbi:hypothetical protein [Halalkalicoccus subterraneus]|uniref:hypothetical protein n=1 Tax=Halalkalicoccus subterraneus TaxID=2675002 RepID=UPI000EFAB2DD|nr:hypothetical protein [Halalkalicoccus subterraneus]
MSTSNSAAENSIASEQTHRITGPHHEPPTVANATTYWRCEACNRESIREQDLHREAFHTEDCEVIDRC